MLIVFEGIDGSGKTSISNRVATLLRTRGSTVEHVREGGRFASRVTQAIREFGRDARNLELTPRAELLLYVARDVQLMDEALIPALGRATVVIADRFLYTAEALARFGRGLPADQVSPVVACAAGGLQPDMVVLVDVDPHVARARRKVSKLLAPDRQPGSRKGLAGTGLQQRLRDGYLEMAAADPERWIVVDNTDRDLTAVVEDVASLIGRALEIGPTAAVAEARRSTVAMAPAVAEVVAKPGAASSSPPLAAAVAAKAAFLDWIDRRGEREPDVAAYFLAGLHGTGIDDRRLALAARAPRAIAGGLKGLCDAVSWELRRRLIDEAPEQIALSLERDAAGCDEAWTMRDRLAGVAPAEVAISVQGLDDDRAWQLRDALWAAAPDAVLVSLGLLDGPRAWRLREQWLADRGGDELALGTYLRAKAACRSVTGLDGERAWQIREAAWEAAPVPSIGSLEGMVSDRAWAWRDRVIAHAPRAVLETIGGLDHQAAWELRLALAARCREALDSMIGLDGAVAWQIRDACVDIWPSTVVKSLGVLVNGARGHQMLERQLARHPDNVSLLKHATAIASGNDLTPHIMAA